LSEPGNSLNKPVSHDAATRGARASECLDVEGATDALLVRLARNSVDDGR